MPSDIIKYISVLMAYGILLIISYYLFRRQYKNKKAPIEIKIAFGILVVGLLYRIYDWIKC